MVSGVSDVDRVYRDSSREQFRPFAGRLEFSYSNGLAMPALLQRVAELPPHTIVYFLSFFEDGHGSKFDELRVVERRGCRRERADVRVGRYTHGSWQCRRQRAEHRDRGECVGERRLAGTERRVSREYPRARDRRQCHPVRLAAAPALAAFARADCPRAASSGFGSPHSGIDTNGTSSAQRACSCCSRS